MPRDTATAVETFGIVITEAMLTKCGPVITCRTGGIPEAAGEHCIYALAVRDLD